MAELICETKGPKKYYGKQLAANNVSLHIPKRFHIWASWT